MSTSPLEPEPKHIPVFSQDWLSSRIPFFKQWLTRYLNTPCNALEIGVYEGRSSLWFLENILTHKGAKLTVIDPFQGSVGRNNRLHETKRFNRSLYARFSHNIAPYKNKITVHKGSSLDVVPSLQDVYDFIYVDGSHKEADVYKDAINSWSKLKPGGTIIFDDYEWKVKKDRPKKAIDRFIHEHLEDIMLMIKRYRVCLVKRP